MNTASQPVVKPRYHDFSVPYLVDETFREGVERCMLTVEVEALYRLFLELVESGVREFVIGCGPEEPALYRTVCANKDDGALPAEVRPIFLVLLNCWDATYANFKQMPRHWVEDTVFSFGMITHKKEERLFERVVNQFVDLGARHLKASVLNNFTRGVDEQKYADICEQIDWATSLGIGTIRINDSVGKLYPEVTAELCERLVADYPGVTFCLHCHNDRALALANQLTSIYHGFTMVEGSLCGYGNRVST